LQALCYSKKYHIYFACTKDFTFVIFNEHLNIVHQEKMPVGLVTQIEFLEKTQQMVVGGKDGCFIIDLDIEFKYDPSMAIMLDPKGTSISLKIKEINREQASRSTTECDPQKASKLPV
jgi:hypothetical protein